MQTLLSMNPAILLGGAVVGLVAVRALYKVLGSPWSVVLALGLVAALVFGTGCGDIATPYRADRTYECTDDGRTKVCTLVVEVQCGAPKGMDCFDLPNPTCRCWARGTATDCRCE